LRLYDIGIQEAFKEVSGNKQILRVGAGVAKRCEKPEASWMHPECGANRY
jgi:hypothetical protein